jgi:hypothetical protein
MTDELNPPDRFAAQPSEPSPVGDSEEPFACPHCGQMLAPTCRVCVACRQPIDPSQIRREPPTQPLHIQAASPAPSRQPVEAQAAPSPALAPVRYPWRMFFLVLAIAWVGTVVALEVLGIEQGRILVTGVQVLSSVWVYFDARQKGLPKPLYWGLGTLFLWIIMFPWYLVRRQRPQAPCPFVEREASPLARLLLAVLALFFLLAVVLSLMSKPGKQDPTPRWHIFPSSGGETAQSPHFRAGRRT